MIAMGIVIGDLLVLLTLAGVGGFFIYTKSERRDRHQQQKLRETEAEALKKAEMDAKRYEAGIPLICLGCETRFLGPLSGDGCPNCHVLSLVVTQDQITKLTSDKPSL
jgi:hypothetical protein